MSDVESKRVGEILQGLQGKRIVVAGDLILDLFVWGKVRRISPEAPVPVVEIEKETERLGGAANVALNLVSIGAIPVVVGVIGMDRYGDQFMHALEESGIDPTGIVRDPERKTSVKTRIIAHNQQVCRTDWESRHALTNVVLKQMELFFSQNVGDCDAVIISDYSKGSLHSGFSRKLISIAHQAEKFVAVDPKQRDFSAYAGASIITPNSSEAERAAGVPLQGESGLLYAGKKILRTISAGYLLITRGEEGMTLFHDGVATDIPTVAREVFDVTGAGDTVIATLTAAVSGGASMLEAAQISNHAAGVVVAKLGTATASGSEILSSVQTSEDQPG